MSDLAKNRLWLGFKTTIEAYDQPFCRTTNLKLNGIMSSD
jgi:hypothetical protein